MLTCFSTVPSPSFSITVTSSHGSPDNRVIVGTNVTLTCTVRLNQAIVESDLSLLTVMAQFLSPDASSLTLRGLSVVSTTFVYTTKRDSFRPSDSGNYTCAVTVGPQSTATFLSGTEILNHTIEITAGEV